MPEQDDLIARFHDLRDEMNPPPAVVEDLRLALATKGARPAAPTTASLDAGPAAPRRHPTRPPSAGPRARAKASGRRGLGALSGGLVAAALAGVMVVTGLPHSGSLDPGGTAWPPPVVINDGPSGESTDGPQVNAADYQAVYQALLAAGNSSYGPTGWGPMREDSARGPSDMSGPFSAGTPTPVEGRGGDYSETNNQVSGIDEGDIVKTDGSHLYIGKGRQVQIVAAQGALSHVVATIDVGKLAQGSELLTGPVVDLMIADDQLIVLTHAFSADLSDWSRSQGEYLSLGASSLKAAFYDISDPRHPAYLATVGQSGSYVTSRLSGDVLYLVSHYSIPGDQVDQNEPTTFVPLVGTGDTDLPLAPPDICIPAWVAEPVYSVATAIDVTTRSVLGEQAVLGGADTVHMSQNNLYLASTNWGDDSASTDTARVLGFGKNYTSIRTEIVRIGLNNGNLAVEADAAVAGNLINQFAIDEQDGYLRVATTWVNQNNWESVPALWVLDSSFKLVGSIQQLVKNEQVQSVRFDGPIAYVVTFRQRDPLFTIDLSDPTKPQIRSTLKIPGFSTYLHPFGDSHLLGVGVNLDNDGNQVEGDQGLKLSMFDISDPHNVKETAVTPITGGDTEVSSDHKAAFIDVERGLIGLPTMSWSWDEKKNGGQSEIAWDYVIYQWNGDSFRQLVRVSLYDGVDSGYWQSDTWARGVRVGGDFYIVADNQVRVLDLVEYTPLTTVSLS